MITPGAIAECPGVISGSVMPSSCSFSSGVIRDSLTHQKTGLRVVPVRFLVLHGNAAVLGRSLPLRRGVAAATALGLAALRPVFFLDADEAQAPAMLADHARTLDPFGKAAEELIEALPLAEFNPHVSAITPPQGVILVRGIPTGPGTTLRDNSV